MVGLAENKANSAPIELELELSLAIPNRRVRTVFPMIITLKYPPVYVAGSKNIISPPVLNHKAVLQAFLSFLKPQYCFY